MSVVREARNVRLLRTDEAKASDYSGVTQE
jgi:hypothetical protein